MTSPESPVTTRTVPHGTLPRQYVVRRDNAGNIVSAIPVRPNPKKLAKPIPVRWARPSKVQSIIFKKSHWTPSEAKAWLNKHGYKAPEPDITDSELRFRQFPPKKAIPGHYASKQFTDSIRALVAEPRTNCGSISQEDYQKALADEKKAIEYYTGLIEKAAPQEKEALTHILEEEIDHGKELRALAAGTQENPPDYEGHGIPKGRKTFPELSGTIEFSSNLAYINHGRKREILPKDMGVMTSVFNRIYPNVTTTITESKEPGGYYNLNLKWDGKPITKGIPSMEFMFEGFERTRRELRNQKSPAKRNPSKAAASKTARWHRVRGHRVRVLPGGGGFVPYVDGMRKTPGAAKSKAAASAKELREDNELARVLPAKGGFEVFKGGKRISLEKVKPKAPAKPKAKAIPVKKAVKPKAPPKKTATEAKHSDLKYGAIIQAKEHPEWGDWVVEDETQPGVWSIRGDRGFRALNLPSYIKHWKLIKPASKPSPKKPKEKSIGMSPDITIDGSHEVFKDKHGNRFYRARGFKIGAPMSMVPGEGLLPQTPKELYEQERYEFLTKDEYDMFSKKEEKLPEPIKGPLEAPAKTGPSQEEMASTIVDALKELM